MIREIAIGGLVHLLPFLATTTFGGDALASQIICFNAIMEDLPFSENFRGRKFLKL